jgi:hypothetical protein
MNFRLAGGFANYGRVEMSVDGVWGTICNRYWDKMDASVFCKSIGFATGSILHEHSLTEMTRLHYSEDLAHKFFLSEFLYYLCNMGSQ